jgi:hypothetical protein
MGPSKTHCHCNNGVQDADETDVDCGGSTCKQCGIGEGCAADMDCSMGTCVATKQCCMEACAGPCMSCNISPHWVGMCHVLHIGDQGACGAGMVCHSNVPGDNGACKNANGGKPNGATCTQMTDCYSGACSNGVCVPVNQNVGYPCDPNANPYMCDSSMGCSGFQCL